MGIRLFQLIVVYVFADKVMDVFFLLPLGEILRRTRQFFHPRLHRLLMLSDLAFFKEVFRQEHKIRRLRIIPVLVAGRPENLRMIQPQQEKYLIEILRLKARHRNGILQRQ